MLVKDHRLGRVVEVDTDKDGDDGDGDEDKDEEGGTACVGDVRYELGDDAKAEEIAVLGHVLAGGGGHVGRDGDGGADVHLAARSVAHRRLEDEGHLRGGAGAEEGAGDEAVRVDERASLRIDLRLEDSHIKHRSIAAPVVLLRALLDPLRGGSGREHEAEVALLRRGEDLGGGDGEDEGVEGVVCLNLEEGPVGGAEDRAVVGRAQLVALRINEDEGGGGSVVGAGDGERGLAELVGRRRGDGLRRASVPAVLASGQEAEGRRGGGGAERVAHGVVAGGAARGGEE